MSSLRRTLYGLGATGVVLGLLALAAVLTTDHNQQDTKISAVTTLLIGWSFIGAGLFAWNRFPRNRLGMLMSAVGFTWLLGAMAFANVPGVFIIGVLVGSLPIAILVHMVLSFPSGRLEDRLARGIATAGYAATTIYMPVPYLFLDTTSLEVCDPACPENPLLITNDLGTANFLFGVLNVVGLILLTMTVWVAVRRWRAADRDDRRTLGPSLWTAVATLFLFGSLLTAGLLGSDDPFAESLYLVALAPLASVPYAFLVGLLRAKLSAAEVVAEENLRLDAELQERYEELRASRARIVEAADAARRKLERDLHDGAQQRLVGLALSLRLARDRLEVDPAQSAALLEEAGAELALATDELRELARGIHPAILTDRGLGAALDALAKRAPVDVRMRHAIGERLPRPVEPAAYFVVAEALTNVYRHSGSDEAEVAISRRNGTLHVEVTDGGNGHADPLGSGLGGLADRVRAQGGEFEVESEPGVGTAIHARIPAGGTQSVRLVPPPEI